MTLGEDQSLGCSVLTLNLHRERILFVLLSHSLLALGPILTVELSEFAADLVTYS